MRFWLTAVLFALVACSGSTADSAVSVTAASPAPSATTDPSPTSTAASTGGVGPQYDVYLAAAADALSGTRYENTPFDDPELFAATGLLVCERLADGQPADDFIFEYLTELTGGDPASAGDDQLVLAGAIVGAATEALCTGPR